MARKMGRPPIDDPKEHQYRLRMTTEEVQKLTYCCERTGMTKAEVFREGLEKVYQEVKEK